MKNAERDYAPLLEGPWETYASQFFLHPALALRWLTALALLGCAVLLNRAHGRSQGPLGTSISYVSISNLHFQLFSSSKVSSHLRLTKQTTKKWIMMVIRTGKPIIRIGELASRNVKQRKASRFAQPIT